jgi:hypothetical protein
VHDLRDSGQGSGTASQDVTVNYSGTGETVNEFGPFQSGSTTVTSTQSNFLEESGTTEQKENLAESWSFSASGTKTTTRTHHASLLRHGQETRKQASHNLVETYEEYGYSGSGSGSGSGTLQFEETRSETKHDLEWTLDAYGFSEGETTVEFQEKEASSEPGEFIEIPGTKNSSSWTKQDGYRGITLRDETWHEGFYADADTEINQGSGMVVEIISYDDFDYDSSASGSGSGSGSGGSGGGGSGGGGSGRNLVSGEIEITSSGEDWYFASHGSGAPQGEHNEWGPNTETDSYDKETSGVGFYEDAFFT